jgi:hypothetical protein
MRHMPQKQRGQHNGGEQNGRQHPCLLQYQRTESLVTTYRIVIRTPWRILDQVTLQELLKMAVAREHHPHVRGFPRSQDTRLIG